MHSKSPRHLSRVLAALVVALLIAPGAAVAKPRRPKPTPAPTPQNAPPAEPARPSQAPPPGIAAVGDRLWHQQTDEARAAMGPFMDQVDSNAHVAAAYGRVLEQEKSYGDAGAKLRRATELAPDDPAAWVYLGEVYLRQQRSAEADTAFRKAAEAAGGRGGAEAAYYLGIAQQRLRQFDEAAATLQGASAPAPALIPYQIGVTRAFQKNWAAAVEQLNHAIEMDSGLAYAYYYRGLAQDKLGHKDQLINDLERFLALAPNAPEAEQARAVLRSAQH